jgi:hypothetical protein
VLDSLIYKSDGSTILEKSINHSRTDHRHQPSRNRSLHIPGVGGVLVPLGALEDLLGFGEVRHHIQYNHTMIIVQRITLY